MKKYFLLAVTATIFSQTLVAMHARFANNTFLASAMQSQVSKAICVQKRNFWDGFIVAKLLEEDCDCGTPVRRQLLNRYGKVITELQQHQNNVWLIYEKLLSARKSTSIDAFDLFLKQHAQESAAPIKKVLQDELSGTERSLEWRLTQTNKKWISETASQELRDKKIDIEKQIQAIDELLK